MIAESFIGDSGGFGGILAWSEPVVWSETGSTAAGAGSGEFAGGGVVASAVGSLGVVWSSMEIV